MKKKIIQRPQTAIVYKRVSTREQADGFSLETQEKICREFAERNKLIVLKVFEERGESAKTTERTELRNMMKFVADHKGQVGKLLIYKVDRLARSSSDYYALKVFFGSYGVQIQSATENFSNDPAGKFLEGILSVVAEFDNNNKSERVVTNMKQALLEGYWPFKAPLGYSNATMLDGSGRKGIVVNPKTAPVIQFVFEQYVRGIYTFRDLSKKVNKTFVAQDIYISPQYLIDILRNPIYCGRIEVPCWEVFVKKGKHEPIIDEKLFARAQVLLNGDDPRKTPRNRNHPDFPLRGIICSNCGHSISGGYARGEQKVRYAYYGCGHVGCEKRKSLPKDKFENEFTEFLEELTPVDEDLDILEDSVKLAYHQEMGLMVTNNRNLELEISKLKEQKEKLIELKLKDSSIISDDDFKSHNQKLGNQIQTLETAMVGANVPQFNFEAAVDFSFALIKGLPRL